MGNSRVLDLRREGPIISSILSPIVQYFPALNTCRMHQDLRRSRQQPPTQKTPGLQLHRKMNRCWWPILLHSRARCPQRTTTEKTLSLFTICKTMHHLDVTPQMRKSLCSWLLDLFRSTTLNVDLAIETWVWDLARLRLYMRTVLSDFWYYFQRCTKKFVNFAYVRSTLDLFAGS